MCLLGDPLELKQHLNIYVISIEEFPILSLVMIHITSLIPYLLTWVITHILLQIDIII